MENDTIWCREARSSIELISWDTSEAQMWSREIGWILVNEGMGLRVSLNQNLYFN